MRALFIAILLAVSAAVFADSPEDVVRQFAAALAKGDLSAAAKLIKGGAVPQMTTPELTIPGLTVEDLASTTLGDYALVTYTAKATNLPAAKEHIVLVKSGDTWLIEVPQGRPGMGFASLILSDPPIMRQARKAAISTVCLSNIKQIGLGVIMFLADNDDKFKLTSTNWRTKAEPYLKNAELFHCPMEPSGAFSYSFNEKLAGREATGISDVANTVMVYEGKNGKLDFRHEGRAVVCFTDGHAKLVTEADAAKLRWNP
jgi:prepilin-type processing-associated H-X9-DG protein